VILAPLNQNGYGGLHTGHSYGSAAMRIAPSYHFEPENIHQRMLNNPSEATEASSIGYQYFVDPIAGQHSHHPSSSTFSPPIREHDGNHSDFTVESQEISPETSLAPVEDRTEESAASASPREANIFRVERKDGKDFKHGNVTVPSVDAPNWDQVAAVTGICRSTITKKGREDDIWDITVIGSANDPDYLVYGPEDIC
jgi:hypothetical protein